MLRMRVYRLAVPLTVLGLDIWALLVIGAGTLMSLQYWQDHVPAILTLPLSAATGFALSKLLGLVKRVFPGRALVHTLAWLSQGDRYRISRESCAAPIVVPREDRFLVRPSRKPRKTASRLAQPAQATMSKSRPVPLEGG